MVARVGQGVYKVGEVPHLVIIQPLAAIQVGGVCVCVCACMHVSELPTQRQAAATCLQTCAAGKHQQWGCAPKTLCSLLAQTPASA